jgi:CRISPR type III-A-associated RAMP protein Csm4
VDLIYHSDTLFSAVTHAMRMLGRLEYWLEVTGRKSALGEAPLVRFTSVFPFFGDTLYVTPPRHIWPPALSVRVHYAGARFIPMSLVESIFAGKPLQDDRWTVDGASECLVPNGKPGPFRIAIRSSAAVDRITGASAAHRTACLEFVPKSGLWFGVSFADDITRDQWNEPIRAAIRLLADSGFGGERSRGWGRAHNPEFREGKLPQLIYKGTTLGASATWLLSLVTPAESDSVDWGQGSYSTAVRGGRVDSPAGSGAAKKLLTMIEEGSVLHASTLEGSAPDVAPEGFSHPVFHAGWAFAIAVPAEIPRQLEAPEPPPVEPVAAAAVEDIAMEAVADEALSDEVPLDDAPEPSPEIVHFEDAPLPPDDLSFEDQEGEDPEGEDPEDLPEEETMPTQQDEAPLEIPSTDDELEQLENQDPGGPDDDLMPPMNDPGPMEPPFSEPEDLTPIDPEPGFENPPGPNPDEPETPAGPVE